MSNFNSLKDKLSSIKSISEKQANKIIIDFLTQREKQYIDSNYWTNIQEEFDNLKFCKKCNKINSEIDDICLQCKQNQSTTLVIVKNQLDFQNLEITLAKSSFNSFVLNLNSKKELIDYISFSNDHKALEEYFKEKNINEVIFALSFTDENKLLIDFIKEQVIDEKIKVYSLAMGLPTGNIMEYIDNDLLEYAFLNKKKI